MRLLSREFGVSACCRALEVPRSTARRPPAPDLERITIAIELLLGRFRRFGVRRMHIELGRNGIFVPRRMVRHAYAQMGLLRKVSRARVRTTNSSHPHPVYANLVKGVQASAPDHIWAADVTYLRIRSRFAYLALVMDLYTRQIVGWNVSFANDTELTLGGLRMALEGGRAPGIHHSDQGSNYASMRYVRELRDAGADISMTDTGRPQDNGFAERLNRTVKEEEILLSEYLNLEEAWQGLSAYVKLYNEDRIHSSLGYRCPSEVFRLWMQNKGTTP